jgi:hypothetical protein
MRQKKPVEHENGNPLKEAGLLFAAIIDEWIFLQSYTTQAL